MNSSALPVLHPPCKAPGAFTELLAEMRHSGAKCAHTLASFAHIHIAGQISDPPYCHGAEHHKGRTLDVFQQPFKCSREPQKLSKIIPRGYRQLQGRSEEAESQHASNSYYISTEIKESAWNLLEEYLSLLSLRSWGACFGKLCSKLGCECSWASWFSPYENKESKRPVIFFLFLCSLMLMMVILKHWQQEIMGFTDSQTTCTLPSIYSDSWTSQLVSSLLSIPPPLFYYCSADQSLLVLTMMWKFRIDKFTSA